MYGALDVRLFLNKRLNVDLKNIEIWVSHGLNHNIKAKIITGERIGEEVFIPRITLNTGDSSSFPFTLFRKQFPIVLAFAITINKSQGQSFNSLGIFIRRPVFTWPIIMLLCLDVKIPTTYLLKIF